MNASLRRTSKPPRVSFALALVVLTALASGASPRIYRNQEFGIVLSIPVRTLLCVFPPQHDHGPVLMLGAADNKACFDLDHNRTIDVFASYNASDRTKKLLDFLSWECSEIAKRDCDPPPEDLRMKARTAAAARVNRGDGWIDFFVVTQAGRPDPAFDPSVPSINYDLRLHTTAEHSTEDLATFREILATIRLSPP